MVLHGFEIETSHAIFRMKNTCSVLNGYSPQQQEKAITQEIKRRNKKLSPLAELIYNEETDKYDLSKNFEWEQIIGIIKEDN